MYKYSTVVLQYYSVLQVQGQYVVSTGEILRVWGEARRVDRDPGRGPEEMKSRIHGDKSKG